MKADMIEEAEKIEKENAQLKNEMEEMRVMYEQKARECHKLQQELSNEQQEEESKKTIIKGRFETQDFNSSVRIDKHASPKRHSMYNGDSPFKDTTQFIRTRTSIIDLNPFIPQFSLVQSMRQNSKS